MGVDIIGRAWNEVSTSTLGGVWKNLWNENTLLEENQKGSIEICANKTVDILHDAGFVSI